METLGKSYFDFWKLSIEDQKELLGDTISFDNKRFYVVEFDEASQPYGDQYGLFHIGLRTHGDTIIWIPSRDDTACIYLWSRSSFSSVQEWMFRYMERTGYFVSIATIYANRKIMGEFKGNESY